tara:strand:+ start:1925 stop:2077 length:153 start_codon:yes stop_codon:yes gene_type:complete
MKRMFGKGSVFYKWWCKDNGGLKYFGREGKEKEKVVEIGPGGVVSVDFWN